MRKHAASYGLLITAVLMTILLMGCESANLPPSISSVQSHFQEYSEDIQIITAFLSSSAYEDVYITKNDGSMLADLQEISIDDPAIAEVIERIIDKDGYQHIIKNGDTISLLQWRGIRDIGCGVAYSINGMNAPQIEYLTQLVPLSDNGWFYYVSDYNAWRNSQ